MHNLVGSFFFVVIIISVGHRLRRFLHFSLIFSLPCQPANIYRIGYLRTLISNANATVPPPLRTIFSARSGNTFSLTISQCFSLHCNSIDSASVFTRNARANEPASESAKIILNNSSSPAPGLRTQKSNRFMRA